MLFDPQSQLCTLARLRASPGTVLFAVCVLVACGDDDGPDLPPDRFDPDLIRLWQSDSFEGCLLASNLRADLPSGPAVIATSGDGSIHAFDPVTGTRTWTVELPEPAGELAYAIATPVIVPGNRLVVTWQNVGADSPDPAAAPRSAHFVAVIDLAGGRLDPAFAPLELAARQPNADGTAEVVFSPANALSRSRLVYANPGPAELGLVYVSFGNARDIQPWHGWVFELDLEAWRTAGTAAAIRSVLLTTPETECGTPGKSGSDDMICGGGVWAPAGPELIDTGDPGAFELVIPTGNGQLDLRRRDYAHTLMRVRGPGLAFDPGCDAVLCADWDVLAPSEACMASCENLFIPRLAPGQPPFETPFCEGLSFFECYAALDWDLGANTPAPVQVPGGPRVLVLPAKDGGVYLLDADHLGTMYDRLEVVDECGTDGVECAALWAGMMVTRPEVAMIDGEPLVVVATFVFDSLHPAGLVGLRVVMRDGLPRLEKAWEAPAFDTEESVARFRRHPSRVRLVSFAGVEYAAVVDQGRHGTTPGVLYLVRVADGLIVHRAELDGPGQRFAQPLAIDDRLYLASCVQGNRGPSHLEAWQIVAP